MISTLFIYSSISPRDAFLHWRGLWQFPVTFVPWALWLSDGWKSPGRATQNEFSCAVEDCSQLCNVHNVHCGHCAQIALFTTVQCAAPHNRNVHNCAVCSPDCIVENWAGPTIEPRAQTVQPISGFAVKNSPPTVTKYLNYYLLENLQK